MAHRLVFTDALRAVSQQADNIQGFLNQLRGHLDIGYRLLHSYMDDPGRTPAYSGMSTAETYERLESGLIVLASQPNDPDQTLPAVIQLAPCFCILMREAAKLPMDDNLDYLPPAWEAVAEALTVVHKALFKLFDDLPPADSSTDD